MKKSKKREIFLFSPGTTLSANAAHATWHDSDDACSDCSTSHRQNQQNSVVFEIRKKLLQNSILHFLFRLSHSSRVQNYNATV